ncbi:hypothetical protein YM3MPS_34740 [Mycobacterium pseudoshottsii]|uniref:hypothetical protein n=1 Tax=Mycobacterium TaxID=1763 RepID=UPI0004055BFB|nr:MULTISPECIES: hypothetical protein [Mycobacterium]MBC9861128.1 secreted protein antigen [Mycobacterium pseudoshottsii]RFZ69669.1 hypothetical protein DL240490_01419 [Mycobacterium marinum]BEH77671.1 hypothetical protein YM3MPS_34740 [Mycobacterium pseudoshottsii]
MHRFIRLAVLVVAGIIAAVLAMADFGLIANAGPHLLLVPGPAFRSDLGAQLGSDDLPR